MLGKRSHSDLIASMTKTTTTTTSPVDKKQCATTHHHHVHSKNSSKKVRLVKEDIIKDSCKKKVSLPDPKQDVDPDVFLSQLVKAQYGFIPTTRPGLDIENYFPLVTEEQIASYEIKVVEACRTNDVETVKSLHAKGHSMNACNRFGESLLHLACRRGFVDMVQFLLETCILDVRILDDCGRTPLHDACWNPTPQLEIVQWLIERDPSLLLIKDKRGSTPFQYARPQDWPTWRQFLLDHYECFDALDKETFS